MGQYVLIWVNNELVYCIHHKGILWDQDLIQVHSEAVAGASRMGCNWSTTGMMIISKIVHNRNADKWTENCLWELLSAQDILFGNMVDILSGQPKEYAGTDNHQFMK